MVTLGFDDPNWRSPLTGSSQAEILSKREAFREMVAYVTEQITEVHRLAELKRQIDLAVAEELKQLEQEERDNG